MINIDTLQVISNLNIEGLIDTINTLSVLDIKSIDTINTISTLDITSVPVLQTSSSINVSGLELDQIIPDTLITRVLVESQDPLWLKVLPFLAAVLVPLAALLFSGLSASWQKKTSLAQIESNERQTSATILQKSRQKWLDSLRESLANMFTKGAMIYVTLLRKEQNDGKISDDDLRIGKENVEAIYFHEQIIKLHLDPDKDDHKNLLGAIHSMTARLNKFKLEDTSFSDFQKEVNVATKKAQIVLDAAWNDIKNSLEKP